MVRLSSLLAWFEKKRSGAASWLTSPDGCTAWAVTATAVFWAMVAEGLRLPGGYPFTHWFYHYEAGFIKRGLIGTIMAPLYELKTAHEIRLTVHIYSLLVLFVAMVMLALTMRKLLLACRGNANGLFLVAVSAVFVFAASPAAAMAGNTTGFMDHFLTIYTVLALFAVERGRYIISAVLSVLGMLTHEIFFCYGLPVIGLALLFQLFYRDKKRGLRSKLALLIANITLPLIVCVLIGVSKSTIDDETIQQLRQVLGSTGALNEELIDQALFPISHSGVFYFTHPPQIIDFLFDENIVMTMHVTAGFFLVLLAPLFAAKDVRWFAALAPFVLLSPLLLFLVAWDSPRFAALSTFHGLFILYVFREHLFVPRAWMAALVAVLGASVIYNSAVQDIWFFDWSVKRHGFPAYRRQMPLEPFNHCAPLFFNSDFEKGEGGLEGWQLEGDAFSIEIATNPREIIRAHNGLQGKRWASSLGDDDHRSATGALISPQFTIREDRLMFLVQSQESPSDLYVSVEVDGKEILRETGSDPDAFKAALFDVGAYVGKQAVLKVVDENAEPGRGIQVDGFCYSKIQIGGTRAK